MPSHSQFIHDQNGNPSPTGLINVGAYFPIEVHVPPQIAEALTNAGQSVPHCATGLALIDTGATLTCVHEPLLHSLGLNPVGTVNSGTASGPVRQNVYPARIVFPTKGWTLDVAQAVGVNLTGQVVPEKPPKPIIALLGRNALASWVFIYNGPAGYWTVAM